MTAISKSESQVRSFLLGVLGYLHGTHGLWAWKLASLITSLCISEPGMSPLSPIRPIKRGFSITSFRIKLLIDQAILSAVPSLSISDIAGEVFHTLP